MCRGRITSYIVTDVSMSPPLSGFHTRMRARTHVFNQPGCGESSFGCQDRLSVPGTDSAVHARKQELSKRSVGLSARRNRLNQCMHVCGTGPCLQGCVSMGVFGNHPHQYALNRDVQPDVPCPTYYGFRMIISHYCCFLGIQAANSPFSSTEPALVSLWCIVRRCHRPKSVRTS